MANDDLRQTKIIDEMGKFKDKIKNVGVVVRNFWIMTKGFVKKNFTPAFLVMLFISFMMWFLIKLGYTYTTEIPMGVNIEGNVIAVSCVAEGTGYRLFSYNYYRHKEIILKWSDVEANASPVNPSAVQITPYSLQNAISAKSPDIKILSIGPIPEIQLWTSDDI